MPQNIFWQVSSWILDDSLITQLSACLMPDSKQAVLDFQTFNWHMTYNFVHYKFWPPIHLSYAEFWFSYTADKETFWAIAQWCCLSAKPTLQSLHGLSDIVVCVHTVVFICFCKKFFATAYHTTPTCSHSSDNTRAVFFQPPMGYKKKTNWHNIIILLPKVQQGLTYFST